MRVRIKENEIAKETDSRHFESYFSDHQVKILINMGTKYSCFFVNFSYIPMGHDISTPALIC